MDVKSLKSILRGEGSFRRYLIKACWKDYVRFCIRCRARKIYRIRRERYRCSQCDYEFSDFAGRWINKVKLPPRDWFRLIKLFELGISARKVSQQLGISYPTVHKAFYLIRQSIRAHSGNTDSRPEGEVEEEEACFQNRIEGSGVENSMTLFPVFGILESKGLVKVEPLQNMSAEAVFNPPMKTARRGSIIYTDRWGSYDALIFYSNKHFAFDSRRRLSRSGVHMMRADGFWSYAMERINKFHGISKERFPLYLKEMEFRYNHRHEPIFNTLVDYLCDLTAK